MKILIQELSEESLELFDWSLRLQKNHPTGYMV